MSKLREPAVLKNIIWVLVGIIIGILASYFIVASSLKDVEQSTDASVETTIDNTENIETTETENTEATETEETEETEETGITTYMYEHNEMSEEEIESARNRILERVDELRHSNSFVQVQTGESSYEAYFYNTNNECYVATSDGSYDVVFRNDNKVVKYEASSGALAVGEDIDILTIIENAVKAAGTSDAAKIYEYPHENSGKPYNEYRIDLLGSDGVRMCYSSLGDDFADIMMENITNQDPDWNPHLVIIVYVPEDDTDRSFGAVSLVVYDEENSEYTSWDLLGWIDLDEWKLNDWWYSSDFSNPDSDEFSEQLDTLRTTIEKLIDNISDDTQVDATGVEEIEDETTEEKENDSEDTSAE